jgi:uncharacterized RDD family membrane protein YckC
VLGLLGLAATVVRFDLNSMLGTWALAAIVILAFILYYGYYAIFEALWNGQTPDKRTIRIRVISTSGRPITVFDALLRNLLRIVDQLPGIYTVGLVSIFVTERNQRLGDLAADTVVVHEQPIERHDTPDRRVATNRRGAARLTPQEITVIETFLARRRTLPDHLRHTTAQTLAARIRTRLDIPSEPVVDTKCCSRRSRRSSGETKQVAEKSSTSTPNFQRTSLPGQSRIAGLACTRASGRRGLL